MVEVLRKLALVETFTAGTFKPELSDCNALLTSGLLKKVPEYKEMNLQLVEHFPQIANE